MNPYRRDVLLKGMLQGEEDRFIGLRDELEWLLARVSEAKPSAVSLVGPVGVGKSFLLTFLADPQGARRTFKDAIGERFSDDPQRLLFVMIDFEDPAAGRRAAPHLIELLYEQTLRELADLLAIPDARLIPLDRIPAERQPSVAKLRALVQKQIARAREEADAADLRERFDATLDTTLVDALIALLRCLDAWGLRVIFLVDDFDNITAALDRADFDHLRALLSAASLVIVTRRALSKLAPAEIQSSPFFNLVQRLNLRRLYFWPPEEARRMITEPPRWLNNPPEIQFSESDVAFILELTGLHPDLICKSCEDLYLRYRRRQTAWQADLLPPEERPFVRAQLATLFTDSFAALWHHLGEEERAALRAIAAGGVPVDAPPPPALTAVINRGYVIFEQGRYRLFAGLFRDYVLEQNGAAPGPEPASVRVSLTELESKLFDLLKQKAGEVVDRDTIIAELYGMTPDDQDAAQYRSRLDALLFRLRKKVASDTLDIENARGQGYRLISTKGALKSG